MGITEPHTFFLSRLLLGSVNHPELFGLTEKLMDHNEERRKYEDMWKLQQTHVNQFLKKCQKAEFTDEEIDRAVGLLWTNSFSCKDSEGRN